MNEEILNQIRELILITLSLNKKKNCWLSIDILNFLIFFNIKKKNQVTELLNTIFFEIIDQGEYFDNLLISSFTNDFLKTKSFNIFTSKPYVNSLSKYIYSKKYEYRSLHPFYSFFNFGSKKLSTKLDEFTDSFGSKSIFNFLIENDFQLHTLGHHYVQSFPIVHHLEHILDVPYRERKYVEGILCSDKKRIESSYNYFFRKNKICERSGLTFNALKKMDSKEIVKTNCIKFSGKKIYSYQVNLKDSAEYITSKNSKENILVDYFHSKTYPNKNLVNIQDSISLYENLFPGI